MLTSFAKHVQASIVTTLTQHSEDLDACIVTANKMIKEAMDASKTEINKVQGFQPVDVQQVRNAKDYLRFQPQD